MLTLNNVKVKDKLVLIRIDINSSIINNKVQCNDRFVEHAKTIKYLLKKGARVVILAHQGRKGKKDLINLEQHARILSKLVKRKIQYVKDIYGKKAVTKIKSLKPGQALLLENVRKLNEETKNLSPEQHSKSKFVKTLAPLFNIFILDAFSAAHRSHASVVGLPTAIKKQGGKACAGFVLEKELRSLKKLKTKIRNIKKGNLIYLLAGAKPKEDLMLLKQALKQKAIILTGGTFCLLCLGTKKKLGKSDELLKKHKDIVKQIKKIRSKNIFLPIDFAIEEGKKRKEISLDKLPINKPLLDIGKKTIKLYKEKIKRARIIIVKGPLGKYEDKHFDLATNKIFRAVASSKAYTVLGGGNTIDAINRLKIPKKKFSYISLGGGTLLQYLSGKKLPGIVALETQR